MLPYVIQWQSQPHPSGGMAELGCRLLSLEIHHNRVDWIEQKLISIGAESLVEINEIDDTQSPYLLVRIETPGEIKILNSKI